MKTDLVNQVRCCPIAGKRQVIPRCRLGVCSHSLPHLIKEDCIRDAATYMVALCPSCVELDLVIVEDEVALEERTMPG